EGKQHLAAVLRLAVDVQRHLELVLGDVVGGNVDLDVDLRLLLLLLLQRRGRVRVLERQILGVLRQHVELGRGSLLGGAVAVGHENSPGAGGGRRTGFRPQFACEGAKMPGSARVAIIGPSPSTRSRMRIARATPVEAVAGYPEVTVNY